MVSRDAITSTHDTNVLSFDELDRKGASWSFLSRILTSLPGVACLISDVAAWLRAVIGKSGTWS